jgi:hypothetical protein
VKALAYAPLLNPAFSAAINVAGTASLAALAVSGSATAPTPTTGNRSTLLATTQMFTNEFAVNPAGVGYQKLSSGLIIN